MTTHPTPDYAISVNGRDITPRVDSRLIDLTLTECRGNESDQLDLSLTDHDGALEIPPKGAIITLQLGWQGALVDKGSFVVDEAEHTGTPDRITVKARSADMVKNMRIRAEGSWHDTTISTIVKDIAQRHGLTPRVDTTLGNVHVPHVDQTHENDLNFLTRLARQHDAVATVKKGHLLFLPINGTRNSKGQPLTNITITRDAGDQHRYHSAERDSYTGVRAYWTDPKRAKRRGVLVGKGEHAKRLKDTYGSEADAMAAARAEQRRLVRGEATFELLLALGRPEVMPQSPVTVHGWKPQIDGTDWLVVKTTHRLDDGGGLTSRLEMERNVAPNLNEFLIEEDN